MYSLSRWLLTTSLVAGLVSHAFAAEGKNQRIVKDQNGTSISVPDHPQRVADLWFAHNALMVMLGGADRIVVTADNKVRTPWMFKISPALSHALQLETPVPTIETLLAAHTDLAILPPNSPIKAVVAQSGIPSPAFGFQNSDGLKQCLEFTAELLNDQRAHEMVSRYETYLDKVIERIKTKTDTLPDRERPTVLHFQSMHPPKIDGTGTVIDDWIKIAGGKNAVTNISGTMREVSVEQVAQWNPDVIILGTPMGDFDPDASGGLWHTINAVKNKKVFVNPKGVFPWDRYGVEYALQLMWVAKALHPQLFQDIDMIAETKNFYHVFFNYDLSTAEVDLILHALPPVDHPVTQVNGSAKR